MLKIAFIRKLPSGQYRLYSRKKDTSGNRKNLGTFDSLSAAKKHEGEVQWFKQQADDGEADDKETKTLSKISDIAQYLERAGFVDKANELYNAMALIDQSLDMDTEQYKSAGRKEELDEEAERILQEDPTALFEIGPEFFSKEQVDKYMRPYAMKNPFSFFNLKLDKKYPDIAKDAAKQALINDDTSFFNHNLHRQYPDITKEHVGQLARYSPKKYFDIQFEWGLYPEFNQLAATSLAKEDKEEFYRLGLHLKYPSLVDPKKDDSFVSKMLRPFKKEDNAADFIPDEQRNIENQGYIGGDGTAGGYSMFSIQEGVRGHFIHKLIRLANKLDSMGNTDLANEIDSIIKGLVISDIPKKKKRKKPVKEEEGVDPLAGANGHVGTGVTDNQNAGMFQGLSDSYMYTGYGNLEGAYGPANR